GASEVGRRPGPRLRGGALLPRLVGGKPGPRRSGPAAALEPLSPPALRAPEQRRRLLDEQRLDLGRPQRRGARAPRAGVRAGLPGDGRRGRVQGRMTFRRCAVGPGTVVMVLALLLAGCVYYPTVGDIGGARLAPERGRVV